ncbi:MAG: hypothetical protein WDZ64_01810, partial [Parcubacteria group bacterium]
RNRIKNSGIPEFLILLTYCINNGLFEWAEIDLITGGFRMVEKGKASKDGILMGKDGTVSVMTKGGSVIKCSEHSDGKTYVTVHGRNGEDGKVLVTVFQGMAAMVVV